MSNVNRIEEINDLLAALESAEIGDFTAFSMIPNAIERFGLVCDPAVYAEEKAALVKALIAERDALLIV